MDVGNSLRVHLRDRRLTNVAPPLIISESELDRGVAAIDDALSVADETIAQKK